MDKGDQSSTFRDRENTGPVGIIKSCNKIFTKNRPEPTIEFFGQNLFQGFYHFPSSAKLKSTPQVLADLHRDLSPHWRGLSHGNLRKYPEAYP